MRYAKLTVLDLLKILSKFEGKQMVLINDGGGNVGEQFTPDITVCGATVFKNPASTPYIGGTYEEIELGQPIPSGTKTQQAIILTSILPGK
jgi:hypothetical protein